MIVAVWVTVGVADGVSVAVAVEVGVAVGVSLGVEVLVGVTVAVGLGVTVGVNDGVRVEVGVAVGVGVVVGVDVGSGTKHTSTNTCVVRTSFDVATWWRTPASKASTSLHCHTRVVAGFVAYVVMPSAYVVVVASGVPSKRDPAIRSSGVATFPLPATSDRLMTCVLTDVIVSVRAPGLSKAYRSIRGPSTVVSVLKTYDVSPSSICAHCQLSVQPEVRFCVCTVASPLGRRIRQFGGGVGLAAATNGSTTNHSTTMPTGKRAMLAHRARPAPE